MNGKATVKVIKEFCVKNAPTILTGISIAELLAASYFWVKNTPKAQEKLKKAEEEKGEKLTKVETVKTAAPAYIPAATMTAMTITTLLLANRIGAKQLAAAIAAYQLSEEAREEFKDAAFRTVGEKKMEEIDETLATSRMKSVPITEDGIINTGKGKTLYFDAWSGRYFWSDRQFLHEVQNDLNEWRQDSKDVCLNDYYDEIGLEEVTKGNEYVFTEKIKLKFTAIMHPTLGIPCAQITFETDPASVPF